MSQDNAPVIDYSTTVAENREPKVWVFALLGLIHLAGIITGFHVWVYLNQPGKDPAAQLEISGPIGLAVALVCYATYFKRTWRLTLPASITAFAIGAIAGLTAIAVHLQQYGWH